MLLLFLLLFVAHELLFVKAGRLMSAGSCFLLSYKDQQGNDNGGKTAGQERKCMHALN